MDFQFCTFPLTPSVILKEKEVSELCLPLCTCTHTHTHTHKTEVDILFLKNNLLLIS